MQKIFLLFFLLVSIISCTKEVPEAEKKLARITAESEIRSAVQNYSLYFNSGDINAALVPFSEDYSEYIPDADIPLDLNGLKNNLINFRSQYPEGKLETKIEDIFASENLAAVQVFTSFLNPDPVERKMNPVYSERSIKLLRKEKIGGWKVFRSLSSTAYSYD